MIFVLAIWIPNQLLITYSNLVASYWTLCAGKQFIFSKIYVVCFSSRLCDDFFFLPVEGDDFSVPDPTELDVFFASGSVNEDMDCINISILDDGALEGDHSFTVSLNPPAAPVTLITPSSSPVTITDNEGTI